MAVTSPTTPNLEGLAGLARRDGIDVRPTLLRVLTDLYVQKSTHTADEERHYTELALRLLDAVDVPTRTAVAKRLAAYPSAPTAVIRRLAHDVIEVASEIIAYGNHRKNAELRATENEHGVAHASAMAPSGIAYDAPRGTYHPELPVPNDLTDLFFAADAADRRLILLNIDYAPVPPAERPATAIVADIVLRLETAALARNREDFSRGVERAYEIPRARATRIAQDQSGEPIVVIARALGMPVDVLQRILLFLNPAIGHSVARVYELARLFDEITPRAAGRMITIWRQPHRAASSPERHFPVHWDDEKTGSRQAVSPQPRRAGPQLVTEPRRLRRPR
jgi:hypothetical protein